MLEDSVASDVTLEHTADGPDNTQGETLVAITRKQQLRDLLKLFADAGITPYSDAAGLRDASGKTRHLADSGKR